MAENKDKKKNFFARTVEKTRGFFGGLRSELKKVTWLTKEQLKHTTAIVLIIVIGSATMIWVFDTVLSKGLNAIGFYTPKEVAQTEVPSASKPAVEITKPATSSKPTVPVTTPAATTPQPSKVDG